VKAHRNLGDALASARRFDEAMISSAWPRSSTRATGIGALHLGSLLVELGRFDEAIAEFRAALKVTPGSVEAHTHLGIALDRRASSTKRPRLSFSRRSKLQPGFADAQRNLAMALDARRRGR